MPVLAVPLRNRRGASSCAVVYPHLCAVVVLRDGVSLHQSLVDDFWRLDPWTGVRVQACFTPVTRSCWTLLRTVLSHDTPVLTTYEAM